MDTHFDKKDILKANNKPFFSQKRKMSVSSIPLKKILGANFLNSSKDNSLKLLRNNFLGTKDFKSKTGYN